MTWYVASVLPVLLLMYLSYRKSASATNRHLPRRYSLKIRGSAEGTRRRPASGCSINDPIMYFDPNRRESIRVPPYFPESTEADYIQNKRVYSRAN